MGHNTLGLTHDFLTRLVKPGAFCIDATAGRGRDTALLCRLTGAQGRVLAFDIQPEAIEQTRALLVAEGLHADLVQDGHEHMAQYVAQESADAIVFNFGRLPGGDPHIMTHTETSLAAIDAALLCLRPGGVMSLALYYGKENGYEERDAILAHLRALDDKIYSVLVCDWVNRPHDPPIAVFLWKN